MARLKRGRVQERMPAEVAARARKGGVSKADWYAGREAFPEGKVQTKREHTPEARARQLRGVKQPPRRGSHGPGLVTKIVAWFRNVRHRPRPMH